MRLHTTADVHMYVSDPMPECHRRPFTSLADHPHLERIIADGPARRQRREARDASRPHVTTAHGDFEIHKPDYDAVTAQLHSSPVEGWVLDRGRPGTDADAATLRTVTAAPPWATSKANLGLTVRRTLVFHKTRPSTTTDVDGSTIVGCFAAQRHGQPRAPPRLFVGH